MSYTGDIKRLGGYVQALKTTGLRKSYQFQIYIEEVDSKLDAGNSFSFFAQSATVPGMTIEMIETQYQGVTLRSPNNLLFESPWNITVRCDSEMKVRDAIETWQKKHADLIKGGGGDKKIPDVRARVDLLDDQLETILKTYILEGVFPSTNSEIPLDHADNSISTFDLGLEYQYWYSTDQENGTNDDPLKQS